MVCLSILEYFVLFIRVIYSVNFFIFEKDLL